MKKTDISKLFYVMNNFYLDKFKFPRGTEEKTKSIIDTWFMFLSQYDTKLVFSVSKKLMVENPIFPFSAGLIVKAIEELRKPIKSYQEAYIEALSYFKDKNESQISKEVKEAVKLLGGWSVLGNINENDKYFVNCQFKDAYETVLRKKEKENNVKVLQENNIKFLEV